MQVVLVMFRAGGDQRSFTVTRDATVIGRREDCDLRIPVGDVSRKHCRLRRDDSALRLQDMGSSNGTFVNDERITEATLNPGDVIRVGPVQFVVQVDGVPAEDEIVRPADPNSDAIGDSLAGDPLATGGAVAGGLAAGATEDLLDDGGAVHAPAGAAGEEPFDLDLSDDPHPVGTAATARAGSSGANAMTIDQTPAEAGDFDAAFLDEAAADPDDEFALADEAEVGRAAAPAAPGLPSDAEAELESIELESLPATEIPAPPVAAADDDDEWDFALDEPEGEPAATESHIGEDPTHHQQPHGG